MNVCFRRRFIVVAIFALGVRQSTSTSLCVTCSAPPTCTGCNINADVITVTNTSWNYYNPATGTPYLEADLQFTAYSVTTTTSVAGNCITHTSSPVPLIDDYIVPIPDLQLMAIELPTSLQTVTGSLADALLGSEYNATYSSFLGSAYSSFYDELGYKGCAATLPPSKNYPTYIGEPAAIASATPVDSSPTALLSANPTKNSANLTEDSGSLQRANSTRIIIVSVVVPTIVLVIFLFCFILIRKYRKKRSRMSSLISPAMRSNVQLYVDQKAELEDEERRKHELDASGITYEMEGEDRIFEMPGDGEMGIRSGQSNRTQELRGADHSKELEVPSNL